MQRGSWTDTLDNSSATATATLERMLSPRLRHLSFLGIDRVTVALRFGIPIALLQAALQTR